MSSTGRLPVILEARRVVRGLSSCIQDGHRDFVLERHAQHALIRVRRAIGQAEKKEPTKKQGLPILKTRFTQIRREMGRYQERFPVDPLAEIKAASQP